MTGVQTWLFRSKRISIALVVLALAACTGDAATTTSAAPPTQFVEGSTIDAGRSYVYTMYVTCGEAFEANGTWWVASEKLFEHPNYPADWPVEILNQSPVDGPDAAIEGVLTVIDESTVEFNLADGTPVAVFIPGQPSRCG